MLSSQVYDNLVTMAEFLLHVRGITWIHVKGRASGKGSRVLLHEMLTVSAVTRKPLCEISSDVCSALLRQYLFHNHL